MKIAIPSQNGSKQQSLYLCAKELEESTDLKNEMVAWDHEFGQDGLELENEFNNR